MEDQTENHGYPMKPIGHLNNPSGDTVHVARELLDKLRSDAHDAQMKAELLRQELEAERAKTPDERLAIAGALIEALKEIADHHCANLSPEFIRDIPSARFKIAASFVDKTVGATQRDSERAALWTERARIVDDWRDRRGTPEWAEHVAAYNEKKLAEQAHAAGYKLVKLAPPRKTAAKTKRRATIAKAASRAATRAEAKAKRRRRG